MQESSGVEPKWTGATAFDNLTDSENVLGDEKYMEQVELGDVDAVLSESIRDYSEVEQKGSIWGMLLVMTIIVAFGVLYLLNPQKSEETTEPLSDNVVVDMTLIHLRWHLDPHCLDSNQPTTVGAGLY